MPFQDIEKAKKVWSKTKELVAAGKIVRQIKTDKKGKEKIDSVLFLISVVERIRVKFFKKMEGTDGLFEVRIEHAGNIYRIFCCFDKDNLVVIFNEFLKNYSNNH